MVGANAFENKDYRNRRYDDEDGVARELFGNTFNTSIKDKEESLVTISDAAAQNSFLDKLEDTTSSINQVKNNLSVRHSLDFRTKLDAIRKNGAVGSLKLKPVQPQRNIINTDYLTLVPKRGRMIDTKSYIRDNL